MIEKDAKNWFAVLLEENFISLLVVIGFLIFGSAYLAYFNGEMQKLKSGGEFDPARRERVLVKRTETLQKLKNSLTALNSINKTDREKINRFLPISPEEASLLATLATIVRDSGLTLLTMDTSSGFESKENNLPGLKTVEVALGVGGGDYKGIKTFLEMVEANLRLLDVESFAFNSDVSAYSFRLRAYYLE